MLFPLPRLATRFTLAFMAASLGAPLSCCARQKSDAISGTGHPREPINPEPPTATGETVAAFDSCIFVVFQAKDKTYWFGSDGQGVYRLDGKAIVHFTTAHGLSGNRIRSIQEDRAGNILVKSDGGVSRFDGVAFRPLAAVDADATGWALGPDDLWFTGWQDEGVVYRYDGTTLHRLRFPKTTPGEAHIAWYPRSEYPGMVFNPYDVYTIFKDSEGCVWFGTHELGVCRFDGTTFAWAAKSELGFDEQDNFGLRSIAEDRDGKFWFSNTLNRFEVPPRARTRLARWGQRHAHCPEGAGHRRSGGPHEGPPRALHVIGQGQERRPVAGDASLGCLAIWRHPHDPVSGQGWRGHRHAVLHLSGQRRRVVARHP